MFVLMLGQSLDQHHVAWQTLDGKDQEGLKGEVMQLGSFVRMLDKLAKRLLSLTGGEHTECVVIVVDVVCILDHKVTLEEKHRRERTALLIGLAQFGAKDPMLVEQYFGVAKHRITLLLSDQLLLEHRQRETGKHCGEILDETALCIQDLLLSMDALSSVFAGEITTEYGLCEDQTLESSGIGVERFDPLLVKLALHAFVVTGTQRVRERCSTAYTAQRCTGALMPVGSFRAAVHSVARRSGTGGIRATATE
mmetsp:Transcript_30092/g.75756  ORF Transcript_30092/g.75756 Transcript_30092/m.75756 type:complete len:252 (-) Transcript_30092:366-1121(-)